MATRAYWSGRIRLALVSIPVHLFPATKSTAKISFNQVHKPSGKRIRYEKVVPGIGPVDADEIQKADKFFSDIPKGDANKELIGLAEELIERKAEKFDPAKFKDPYTEAVQELIDAKLEKRPPKEIEEPQQSAQVIDLMQALKRSVRGKDAPNVREAPAKAKKTSKRSRAKTTKRGASKRKAA